MSQAATLGWIIDPLPDFLEDHTLAAKEMPERMREQAARWVQFVAGLWAWKRSATFALRFVSRDGRIAVYFLALAHAAHDAERLGREIDVLLRSHRLLENPRRAHVVAEALYDASSLANPAIIELSQYVTRTLWQPPAHVSTNDVFARQYQWLTEREWREPLVIYPWWGLGGPFLIPMESLISQPEAASLTVFLEPTELSAREIEWLGVMARVATSSGDQNLQQLGSGASVRSQDPSAALAGRLYMANLRRLSTTPFLVSVQCAAANQNIQVARTLAGAMQALVHETPFDRPQQEEQKLPSGATLRGNVHESGPPPPPSLGQRLVRQAAMLRFELDAEQDPLARIPYLADAQGAATVFRLPASVRGGVPGIRVQQLPPDFHPGSRHQQCPPGHMELGRFHAGGRAFVRVRDFTKHVLVTGFTGSGKTVTVMQILHRLWVEQDIPFLVLESAKQEYRGLASVEALRTKQPRLRIYTLGNELVAPFRLNPFELLPGVRVEAHLSKLQSCFEGAIPPVGPSSSIISEALLRVYEKAGWSLTDVYPLKAQARRQFPTLEDFVKTVHQVLVDRAYEGEVKSNLQAALVGRFKPLLLGGKGRMFNTQRSAPSPSELFSIPTVLEMNDLNIEDKALVTMFLLTLLREYRESDRSRPGELKHITVVEEAHNVLENVSSVGTGEGATAADTRHKAVQAFCSLLTEIRALGEGLVIADQSPEKLARDAIRNTNLQIAHQLRDAKDRDAIAQAMIMEKEQRDYLGKLAPGHAAFFQTGLEKATFIQVHPYLSDAPDSLGRGFAPFMDDSSLADYMDRVEPALKSRRQLCLPFPECALCSSQCQFRDAVFPVTIGSEFRKKAKDWLPLTDRAYREAQGLSVDDVWKSAISIGGEIIHRQGISQSLDASWCCLLHLWDSAIVQAGYNRADPEHQLESSERVRLAKHLDITHPASQPA